MKQNFFDIQSVPEQFSVFKDALFLQKFYDFKNFFTVKSVMN